MTARRTLLEGMRSPALTKEQAFVRGEDYVPPQAYPAGASDTSRPETPERPIALASVENPGHMAHPASSLGRSSITTRIRSDYFDAVKKASLERQLHRREQYTMVDIVEEALGQWLIANGYLPKSS